MLTLANRISDGRPANARSLAALTHLVVHYTGLSQYERGCNEHPIPDAELDAVKLTEAFCRGGMRHVTGGASPYHVLVRLDGTVEQALPLRVRGAHVPGFNYCSLAIAYVGEPRLPTPAQQEALTAVLSDLLLYAGHQVTVTGHTALVPKKDGCPCPHPRLDVSALAWAAQHRQPDGWTLLTRAARDTLTQAAGYQLDPVAIPAAA